MINIKRVEMIDTREAIKQIIYAPTETTCVCEKRDMDIMQAVVQVDWGGEYYKFEPQGIKGAERIKNSENLWYDSNHNIWQVCCGHVKDMNGNDIPNCWNVRVVGTWFEFD
jgi:hypothetical protein